MTGGIDQPVTFELHAVERHRDLALADAQEAAIGNHQMQLLVAIDEHLFDAAEIVAAGVFDIHVLESRRGDAGDFTLLTGLRARLRLVAGLPHLLARLRRGLGGLLLPARLVLRLSPVLLGLLRLLLLRPSLLRLVLLRLVRLRLARLRLALLEAHLRLALGLAEFDARFAGPLILDARLSLLLNLGRPLLRLSHLDLRLRLLHLDLRRRSRDIHLRLRHADNDLRLRLVDRDGRRRLADDDFRLRLLHPHLGRLLLNLDLCLGAGLGSSPLHIVSGLRKPLHGAAAGLLVIRLLVLPGLLQSDGHLAALRLWLAGLLLLGLLLARRPLHPLAFEIPDQLRALVLRLLLGARLLGLGSERRRHQCG